MLSPAAIVYENELFYTSFVSMLFLLTVVSLLDIKESVTWRSATGIFLPLLLICLTRSMYHILWLLVISVIILFYAKRKQGYYKLFFVSFLSIILVSTWYVKNYFIFGEFTTSTWIGMNFSRNVFHDQEVKDSSQIAAFAPFSRISVYNSFRDLQTEKKFAGLNDRDLIKEFKNDSFMNMNHVGYIPISKKYMAACKAHIKAKPVAFLKNVAQSAIIFFAPATRYSVTEFQAKKIKYYDAIYSFNLSHFAKSKQERRIALTVSAIPKGIIYLLVFAWLIKDWIRKRRISLLNLFICSVIGYVFITSSLIEHYENMRFRFELEPLFLLVLAQPLSSLLLNRPGRKAVNR
jgi:hypothetical protein